MKRYSWLTTEIKHNFLHLWEGALALLPDQGLVDVGNHPTPGDGGLDQRVELLVPPDGELQVPGGDSLHFQVLTGIVCQLLTFSKFCFIECKSMLNSLNLHNLVVPELVGSAAAKEDDITVKVHAMI